MVCMIYESYEIECTDMVLLCMYTLCYGGRDPYFTGGVRRRCYIYICREEGTRMARAECEDGAIYHVGRKGPVWHGRSAKTVLYIMLGGRDLYGTGGVRRRCYDIHIIASLQMIENEWLCVIQMCVCVTLGVCWMCYRI